MIYSTCTSWEYRTITLIRNNELPSKVWKQRETQRNKEKHRKGNTLNQKPSTV